MIILTLANMNEWCKQIHFLQNECNLHLSVSSIVVLFIWKLRDSSTVG